jgi:hypothetical protein
MQTELALDELDLVPADLVGHPGSGRQLRQSIRSRRSCASDSKDRQRAHQGRLRRAQRAADGASEYEHRSTT